MGLAFWYVEGEHLACLRILYVACLVVRDFNIASAKVRHFFGTTKYFGNFLLNYLHFCWGKGV